MAADGITTRTILIVEDDRGSRLAFEAVLDGQGYRLLTAADGAEALDILETETPDLIIADLLLPAIDGYELVHRLRRDPAHAGLPVIFCTASHDSPEAKALAASCGVSRIIAKPAAPTDIREQVAAALAAVPPAVPPLADADLDREHQRLLAEKLAGMAQEPASAKRQISDPFEVRNPQLLVRPLLLVEDNPMDLDFILQAFEENKVANSIVICRDGEEALRFMELHQTVEDRLLPLLVLLDLRLPKVDGIEVLRQARTHPVWRQIPFIVLTTSRQNQDVSAAYELGVNSYIVKPVDFNAFAEVARNIKVYWLLTNEPPFPGGEAR